MRVVIVLAAALCSCGGGNAPGTPDLGRDLSLSFPAGCMSGAKDGNETDVDCGGDACPKCGAGQMCLHGSDCDSGICDNNHCAAPSCTDQMRNGTETDLDCGGSCPGCAVGKMCLMGTDCQSGSCVNNTCQTGPCANGVKDGMETDVDCGGPVCSACADGKMCLMVSDCQGMRCVNNVCRSAINCAAPMANCDGNPQSGCNVNLSTDPKNCGKCGSVCPMNAPTCSAGTCQAGPKVILIYSSPANLLKDVQTKLMSTGSFSKIDIFDAEIATPTLNQLTPYDVAFVYNDRRFLDTDALGNVLATYFQSGGRVVLAPLSNVSVVGVMGNFWMYRLITPSGTATVTDKLGAIKEPQSSLVAGVNALSIQSSAVGTGVISNQGVVVAEWASGKPLIVRGTFNGKPRVDINLYPISADAVAGNWVGDGLAIMRNALLFK